MSAEEWGNAGSFEFQAWIVDSSGYPMGQLATPDSPVQGTTYHAYRSRSFVSMTPPTPERSLATFFGGQTFLGQLDLGINNISAGELAMAMFEETLNAMATGALVDETTITGWAQSSANEMQPNLPQMGVMGTTKILRWDGVIQWVSLVFPKIQLRPPTIGIGQGDGQNPNNLNWGIVAQPALGSAEGRLFSSMGMNLYDDKGISYFIRSTNRLALSTHIVDATMAGTGASFNLGYLPLSSTVDQSENSVANEGVDLAVTTINTTTGAVAVAAGETAGERITVLYGTDFAALP